MKISLEKLEILTIAIRDHSEGAPSDNITVQTCWDSDRLDLGRVGIDVDKAYLGTKEAKSDEIFNWATQRACENHFSPIVYEDWLSWLPEEQKNHFNQLCAFGNRACTPIKFHLTYPPLQEVEHE